MDLLAATNLHKNASVPIIMTLQRVRGAAAASTQREREKEREMKNGFKYSFLFLVFDYNFEHNIIEPCFTLAT